ncbi:hypothetical protein A7D33_05470 [Candidatus Methylacidiphilum fumarolicum]|nr:hypothetical protein A7D33_05470 [Candidatus Methylacidiphilum fumarolicum]
MGIKEKRIVLPMGRGGSFLILPRPAWLLHKSACLILWNDLPNEWHITLVESAADPNLQEPTEQCATVDFRPNSPGHHCLQQWEHSSRFRESLANHQTATQ